jgi:membrane protein YqaA with SNARE-associated domain
MGKESHHTEHKPRTRAVQRGKWLSFTDKLFLLLVVVSIAYIGYLYFQEDILEILRMNPYVWAFFSQVVGEISKRTLLGLFYTSFFGSLFFIVIPIEVLFIYYLTLGYSVPIVIALTMIGNIMGLCLDYLFGFIVGAKILKFFFGEKFDRFQNIVTKWGAVVVFFGNVIIFPIQPVSVVIGSAKYSFKKFLIFTILGIFVKIFTLLVVSFYLKENLYPIIQGLI